MVLPLRKGMRITCPNCGGHEKLRGTRMTESIRITCGACLHSWIRTERTCPVCGKETLTIGMRAPILQKARGAQQSIIGYRTMKECTNCGHQSGDARPPENYKRDF